MKEEKIITKDEYMDWLERVTLIENGIDSTTLKALPQLLIVNKDNPFALIYDRVDEFATKNNIEKKYSNGYEYYNFKYNDIGYTMLKSNDNKYICYRAKHQDPIDHYIDFNRIIEDENSIQKVKKKK